MAHFAKIGLNNKVIGVHVLHDNVLKDANGAEQEVLGIDFLTKLHGWAIWKQTSYNANFRGNYAGIGYTYMENVRTLGVASTDIFINQQLAARGEVVVVNENYGIRLTDIIAPDSKVEEESL